MEGCETFIKDDVEMLAEFLFFGNSSEIDFYGEIAVKACRFSHDYKRQIVTRD